MCRVFCSENPRQDSADVRSEPGAADAGRTLRPQPVCEGHGRFANGFVCSYLSLVWFSDLTERGGLSSGFRFSFLHFGELCTEYGSIRNLLNSSVSMRQTASS